MVPSKIRKATNENPFFDGLDDDTALPVEEEVSPPENMPISPGRAVPAAVDALTHPEAVSVATPIGSTRYGGMVFITKGMKFKTISEDLATQISCDACMSKRGWKTLGVEDAKGHRIAVDPRIEDAKGQTYRCPG